MRASQGYADPTILERTRAALIRVRDGEAAFERDSVTFKETEYQYPLLAALLRVAASNNGKLSVLDFGGSLGSSYFQSRGFLSHCTDLRWSVVEQRAHVECGRADFANEQLRFYFTIEECLQSERPDVLLLSSVIHYLPEPYAFLEQVLRHDFPSVVVDRTPYMCDGNTRLTVEHVPAWIYPASYPAWFLSEERFLACFGSRYQLVARFPALDDLQPEAGEAKTWGHIFDLADRS